MCTDSNHILFCLVYIIKYTHTHTQLQLTIHSCIFCAFWVSVSKVRHNPTLIWLHFCVKMFSRHLRKMWKVEKIIKRSGITHTWAVQCSSAEFGPALAMMVQHSGHPVIAKKNTTTQLSSTANFFHDFIHQALTLLAGSYLQLSLHLPLALPLHVHLTLPSLCFVVGLCVCSGFVPEICLYISCSGSFLPYV